MPKLITHFTGNTKMCSISLPTTSLNLSSVLDELSFAIEKETPGGFMNVLTLKTFLDENKDDDTPHKDELEKIYKLATRKGKKYSYIWWYFD